MSEPLFGIDESSFSGLVVVKTLFRSTLSGKIVHFSSPELWKKNAWKKEKIRKYSRKIDLQNAINPGREKSFKPLKKDFF